MVYGSSSGGNETLFRMKEKDVLTLMIFIINICVLFI